jgi:hypothetical protein
MDNVIVFFDDMAIITNGSFEDHLNVSAEVPQRLTDKNQQLNGKNHTSVRLKQSFYVLC